MIKIFSKIALILFTTLLSAQDNTISNDSITNLINAGFKNIETGELDKAISQLTIALEHGKANNNQVNIAAAYNALGVAYLELNNINKVKEYFNKLSTVPDSIPEKPIYYNNIAHLFELKNDTVNALKHYLLSQKLCLKKKDTFYIVWPEINIGIIKYSQKKFDEAKFYFERAYKNYVPNSLHQSAVLFYSGIPLANMAIDDKQYTSAEAYLKRVEELALEVKNYDELFNIEKARYKIYRATNKQENARRSLEKQVEYISTSKKMKEDQLFKNSKLEQKLLEKEKAIEFKNKINNSQREALNQSELFTYITLALLSFTFIFLYLLLRSNYARKKLNQDLIIKNQALHDDKNKTEYASKIKENFLSTISHELRTPLYAVTGITDILIEDNPKKEHKHYLKALKSSGEHLLGLINNILQINKYDADKIQINTTDFNIRSLMNNIKESLSYLKNESNNKIHIDIDESTPHELQGDSLKIAQIIVNLLSNALKFTKDGDIWIIIKNKHQTADKVTLEIKVKDDGIGISKEKQTQIFEDFYQESMRLNRNYEGTGLGLSIVKRLLNVMHSEIKVQSELNKGATFYFDLTLKVKESEVIKEKPIESNTSYKNNTILVVDDNTINLMITKRLLESKQAIVTTVENGVDAIEKAKNDTFDLILMDIHMPNMNGYTTTKTIRSFDKITPIIALTAVTLDDSEEKILDSGMNDVIVKPFQQEVFYKKLNRLLVPY